MRRTWSVSLLIAIVTGAGACSDGSTGKPIRDGGVDLGGFVGQNDLAMNEPGDDLAEAGDMAGTGGACASAMPVMNGTTVPNQDTSTATQDLTSVCYPDAEGKVLFYSVTIPSGYRLKATATPVGDFDGVIRVLDGCAATDCLTTADSGLEGDSETAVYLNSDTAAKTVIIAVGSYYPQAGGFNLDIDLAATAVNAQCMMATPVTAGPPLTGQDARGAVESQGACLYQADGNVLYYSTTIPARTKLTATATPTGMPSWDPALRVLATCTSYSCLASADNGLDGDPETAEYRNTAMTPKSVVIAVGSVDASVSGTFDLQLSTQALPPAPPSAVCATAVVINDGDALVDEDASEATDKISPSCGVSGAGAVLYYKATIPAHYKLTAKVTPTGSSSWDPVMRLLPSCGGSSCLADADDGGSGSAETLAYENSTAAPVTVYLAVGSYSASSTGTFNLDVKIESAIVAQDNAQCMMATALVSGGTLTGENLAGTTTTLTDACLPTAVGPVLFYSATVPAGHRFIARGKSTDASWDIALRVLGACNAMTCLAEADDWYAGYTEVASYKNAGVSPAPVILAVGNYTAGVLGTFDLTTWIKPPPSNTTCPQSQPVSNGTLLAVEDGESATDSASSKCLSSAGGKVLYYSVSIPAGKTLNVKVTPIGRWDPVIRLLNDCAASTCLASKDAGATEVVENLTYTNSSGSLKPVVIAVGGYGSTTGAYDLQITIP